MATTEMIEVSEAQERLGELLTLVAAGFEVILTGRGTPLARIVAIEAPAQRRIPGLHPGAIQMADDFDAPLPDEFWSGSP
jgi:prevent-host-death family protein